MTESAPLLKPPEEPPPSYGDARAALAARYLAGNGIEIGALHSPLTLPADTEAKYVDRMPASELRLQYPTLANLELVEVDVVDDGELLSTFADGSLDFIVASHFLEHCEDPIATIEHHLDKLVPGGVLFYVVPDKRFTFDVNRPVTPLEHMIADYERGPETSRRDHVEEAARLTWSESPRSEQDVRDTIDAIEASGESIHMHVWTQAEFLALLLHCRDRFDDAFDIEAYQRHLIEVIVVLRKSGVPRSRPPADRAVIASTAQPSGVPAAQQSEIQQLALERNRVQSELEHALDREAEALAEHRRVDTQLTQVFRSPSWRLTRPLRLPARARRRASSSRAPRADSTLVSVSLSALRPDLAGGWPVGARWRPDVRIPGLTGTVLEQPTDTTIRYRLVLPPGARVRARVALGARVWKDVGAGAAVSMRLLDANGQTFANQAAQLTPAVGGGVWSATTLELQNADRRDVVLEFDSQSQPATVAVPRVLWGAPEVLIEPAAIVELAALSARSPTATSQVTLAHDVPLISLLTPVHDPDPDYLDDLLAQVRAQTFADWELCLVDDGSEDPGVRAILDGAPATDSRIRLQRRPQSGGISVATNDALAMANGTYIALLDHDDLLAGDALQTVADAVTADPAVDMLYSDEDHITPIDQPFLPYRKPDWAPDTLLSQMYTCHLGVFRRQLALDVGGFRPEFDGSQDYDFVLRVVQRTDRIRHINRILYHWRVHAESAASGAAAKPYAYDAARRALQSHLDRGDVNATVEFADLTGTYRTVYEVDPGVSVDVVLPVVGLKDMDDSAVQLRRALAMGGHERWQLVLAGADVEVQRCADALRNAGVGEERIREATSVPAVGAALGAAVRASQADHVLFVNDAVIARTHGWLRTLLGFCGQPGVAAVGAKVLAFDGRVEHAGVVIGDGLPLPVYHGADGDELGHLATLVTTVNRSAVTGVVMVPRATIDAVGLDEAFDELALVDYCLRAADLGLRTLWTPDALVSLTRGGQSPRNDIAILAAFAQRWRSRIDTDPFYNRALWQERADFTILEGS